MIPFEHIFWANPHGQFAVLPNTGQDWHFPSGCFSSPILTLPDWYGPWPEINQAYWRSECAIPYAATEPGNIGVQLVAMTYDLTAPVVLCELTYACKPKTVESAAYNRNVTATLKESFASAVPSRNNAIQIGVRIKSDTPGAMIYSSRLMIAWKN